MVLEKMLKGLKERRQKVVELRTFLVRMEPVDDGQDIDRLLARFVKALDDVIDDIDQAMKRSKVWFGEEKDGDD